MNPLHYLTEGIWRDEAFSYLMAKHSFIEIVGYTVRDFNPPLYYFLLHIWMMLFGSSEIAMRSLSLLFYVLGVFCMYEIFKVILKKTHLEAAIYTSFCALNPLVFYYAFETRMYSMLFFLAMAASFYYLKKDWRNYIIVAVIGMYTHYFMGLVLVAQFVHWMLPQINKHLTLKKLWLALKPFVYIGLLFMPWALYFVLHNSAASSQYWIVPLMQKEMLMLPGLTYSGIEKDFAAGFRSNPYYQQIVLWFSAFFFACVGAGFHFLKKKKLEKTVFTHFVLMTILPLLVILLIMPIKPLYVPRYMIFVSAAMSMCFILAFLEMPKKLAIPLLAVLALFTIQFQAIQFQYRVRETTKNVVAKIKPLAGPNDVIYVQTDLDLMTAQYYFGENRVFLEGEKYEDIPSYVGKVLIPPSRVVSTPPTFPNKAFVITGSNSYEIRSQFP